MLISLVKTRPKGGFPLGAFSRYSDFLRSTFATASPCKFPLYFWRDTLKHGQGKSKTSSQEKICVIVTDTALFEKKMPAVKTKSDFGSERFLQEEKIKENVRD